MTTSSNHRSLAAFSIVPSILGAVSVVAVFVAGRIFEDGSQRVALAVAVLLSVAAAGWRITKAGMGPGARAVAVRAAVAHVAVAVGAVAVVASTIVVDTGLRGALVAGATVVTVGGAAVLLALELLMAQTRATGFVDLPRVQRATSTAVTLVAGIAALMGLVYGVQKSDARLDLAYAAPTSPSGATSAILDAASCGDAKEKPEVILFFERGSTAYAEVADYFDGLRLRGARVSMLDQALDPALAKVLKVTKNGTVAFRCGEKTESYVVGAEREDAQRKLRKLDQEVRTKLGKLTRDAQDVYVTVGHGERSVDETDKSGRSSAKSFKKLLDANNAKIKKLGIADGLTNKVPDDAALVLVLGPQQPFLAEEASALAAYVTAGGSVALFLDPPRPGSDDVDVSASLQPLLKVLGIAAGRGEVLNDKEYVKQSNTSADHAFVFSTSFGSHKSVKTLSGSRGKTAVLFQSAQALRKDDDVTTKLSVIARSRPGTWSDIVADRRFDETVEKRDILDLAAVVEVAGDDGKEGRALVVGDSDVAADLLLSNEANAVFVWETLQWLLRDDTIASAEGATVVEDAPIRHTRDEDTLWFYGTTLLGPLVVFGVGFVIVRLRRSSTKKKEPAQAVTGGAA